LFLQCTIGEEESCRADLAILKALQGSSEVFTRSRLQRLMALGRVCVGGLPVRPNAKLPLGTQVEIDGSRDEPLVSETGPLEVLYEDPFVLVLNKPCNLVVHPASSEQGGTLVHRLLHQVDHLSSIAGVLRPGIVHRLDKHTSGALVIAKTDVAHLKLVQAFAQHAMKRVYWALCYSAPREREGTVRSLFGRNPQDRKKMSAEVRSGKTAVTHFQVKQVYPDCQPVACWMEVTLETGRTHQVRVHLTSRGNSLLGDPVYGVPSVSQAKWKNLPTSIQALVKNLPGQALHAACLGFHHPMTGEWLEWEAPPPESFQSLKQGLEALGNS
jgi:23S rRNA pseudouridine1911/1915/1917 synthase